jgi:hypothetical protein
MAAVAATTGCERCCFDCPPPPETPIVAAVDEASLIFEGTVLPDDAIKADDAAGSERGFAVRVGQVLRAPGAVGDLTDDTVTVVPRDTKRFARDGHAVFFGYTSVAGSKLVVQEVKRIAVASQEDVERVQASMAAADSTLADSAVLANSTAADAVVLARIQSVAEVDVPDSLAALGSEHAPEWKLAIGEVRTTFRKPDSALVHQRLAVLFASGESSLTEAPPQPRIGETQILWLRRMSRLPESLRLGIDTTNRFFVLQAEDWRPSEDSGRIARILVKKYGPPIGGAVACKPVKRRSRKAPTASETSQPSPASARKAARPVYCGLSNVLVTPIPERKAP